MISVALSFIALQTVIFLSLVLWMKPAARPAPASLNALEFEAHTSTMISMQMAVSLDLAFVRMALVGLMVYQILRLCMVTSVTVETMFIALGGLGTALLYIILTYRTESRPSPHIDTSIHTRPTRPLLLDYIHELPDPSGGDDACNVFGSRDSSPAPSYSSDSSSAPSSGYSGDKEDQQGDKEVEIIERKYCCEGDADGYCICRVGPEIDPFDLDVQSDDSY